MRRRNLLLGLAVALCSISMVRGSVIYGSLSNFDCVNDTNHDAHGFEIELEGIDSSSVYATFGAPYNRYGEPTITTVGTRTFVRWGSSYSNGVWAESTIAGSIPNGTGGHSLYIGSGFSPNFVHGSTNNVPGDHFGVALNSTPTNTIYHWLLEDATQAGALVLAGTNVRVPAPVFQPVPGNPEQIQVVVPAPPPEENQPMFGDAIWVKVFTTVVEGAEPVELEDLLLGNPAVPGETETEIFWTLLQAGPDGTNTEQIDPVEPVGANESVTRRYEFFEYIGGYNPEDNEVLHDSYAPEYVGDFIGTQNVAANFAPIPEPATAAVFVGLMGLGLRRARR